ncbi:hypothetical protein [Martelella sp. FOR1707]
MSRTFELELTVAIPAELACKELSDGEIRNEFFDRGLGEAYRKEILDDLSDDFIKEEFIERGITSVPDDTAEIEHLGRLIAAGKSLEALELLREIAPPRPAHGAADANAD